MNNNQTTDEEEVNEKAETSAIPKKASKDSPATDWQSKAEEFEHKYKLALADYQNLLKQSANDRRDSVMYANQGLIMEILPIYDNLKLSLKHGGEASENQWLAGISYVIAQFKKALEEAGVKEIATSGESFDPMSMEAVENRETGDKKLDGKVAEELKGGYMLNEKILVPARVAVYKLNN